MPKLRWSVVRGGEGWGGNSDSNSDVLHEFLTLSMIKTFIFTRAIKKGVGITSTYPPFDNRRRFSPVEIEFEAVSLVSG